MAEQEYIDDRFPLDQLRVVRSAFDSPNALLARSREHLEELNHRFNVFANREPYSRVVKLDREARRKLFVIRFHELIPHGITVVAFDAVNIMRSALDHAVYASAEALGYSGLDNTKFPFGNTPEKVKEDAARRGGCHPVAEIREFLVGLEPHQGGRNETLWALNKLRNIKNHRSLVRFGLNVGMEALSNSVLISPDMTKYWNDERTEYTHLSVHIDCPDYTQYDFSLFIEIGETELLNGKPALSTFLEIGREIQIVVKELETRTLKILTSPR